MREVQEKIETLKQFDAFAVLKNHEVIGIIGYPCIDKSTSQYGLFYRFKKSVGGNGYATKAVQ